MAGVKIKIPKIKESDVVNIPKGELGDFKEKTERRFEKIDNILFAIIASVVISGIAVVISVLGIFLDQLRFNNAAYQEYLQKNSVIENLQKSNNVLNKEIKSQQKLILLEEKKLEALK